MVALIQGVCNNCIAVVCIEIGEEAVAAIVRVNSSHHGIHALKEAHASGSMNPCRSRNPCRGGQSGGWPCVLNLEAFQDEVLRASPGSGVDSGPSAFSDCDCAVPHQVCREGRT